MKSSVIRVNPKKPEKFIIEKAAKIIKRGGLVAFPTETVYGLGANALDKKAVRKIFEAKGRPLDNPIIVHIAKIEDLNLLARNIPKEARILTKEFWPGPLTLVLFKKKVVVEEDKSSSSATKSRLRDKGGKERKTLFDFAIARVPDEVTAGADTVAIRMPKNKIALELIKSSGVPIAAPSANLAGRPSPTTASHVFEDLGDKIDLILDGGRTKIGVESTVLDLTVKPPQILRPGGVNLEELKKVLKEIKPHFFLKGEKLKDKIVKSPGMKYRHYAPKAPLILVEGKEQISKIQNLINYYKKKKKKVGVMATSETKRFYKNADLVLAVGSKKNLEKVAQNLFKALREFDKKGVDIILAESFPERGIGFAIMHRLRKAAKK